MADETPITITVSGLPKSGKTTMQLSIFRFLKDILGMDDVTVEWGIDYETTGPAWQKDHSQIDLRLNAMLRKKVVIREQQIPNPKLKQGFSFVDRILSDIASSHGLIAKTIIAQNMPADVGPWQLSIKDYYTFDLCTPGRILSDDLKINIQNEINAADFVPPITITFSDGL
jgi:hypothetical protein